MAFTDANRVQWIGLGSLFVTLRGRTAYAQPRLGLMTQQEEVSTLDKILQDLVDAEMTTRRNERQLNLNRMTLSVSLYQQPLHPMRLRDRSSQSNAKSVCRTLQY